MIIKRRGVKNVVIKTMLCLVVATIITGIFKYHHLTYTKKEYDRICPQNYGDPVSLDLCYTSYKLEGKSLENALKTEVISIFIVPILIVVLSLI